MFFEIVLLAGLGILSQRWISCAVEQAMRLGIVVSVCLFGVKHSTCVFLVENVIFHLRA